MPADDLSFYAILEQYPDEASAERYFIQHRWPHGVNCPICGSVDVLRGTQPGRRRQLWNCHGCGKQFSVTSGTIMSDTKLPLRKWLLAFHFMGASKKGMSALQLSRMLKLTYKSAWHLCHRIRAAMANNSQVFTGIVETDETYIGGRRKGHGRGYRANKSAVQTIVRRNEDGENNSQAQTIALSHENVDGRTVGAKLRKHTIPSETVLMTDESPIYTRVGESFSDHHTVNHRQEEYVRTDMDGHLATTNTAEGLFANLKRQITGTHHHTSKKHLPRYLEEFDYKYNNRQVSDGERTSKAIGGIEGKRLKLYKSTSGIGDSLFDGKAGEPRRRPKRPVKKRRSTKGVGAPLFATMPATPAPSIRPQASTAPVVPRSPAPPTSIMWGRELPRVAPKAPVAGKGAPRG
jgi:transposase-like protein